MDSKDLNMWKFIVMPPAKEQHQKSILGTHS